MKRLIAILYLVCFITTVNAQQKGMHKMSPWLRMIVRQAEADNNRSITNGKGYSIERKQKPMTHAFIRTSDSDDSVLNEYGAKSLAKIGDIHIAQIPVSTLRALSSDDRILRIEARPIGEALCDTMPYILNTAPVYAGENLPQAYTGKGVVVGIMDIGFDLTCPNFYNADMTNYRIKRLWDMLSPDTIGSQFPVGRDYTTKEELLSLQHSRDGKDFTHGTYTTGIAAGSGNNSPYRGMAPGSELCLVANAVSNNIAYVDSSLYDRFTYATDALGFKYIFDYAKSVNKPCVISLSEGGTQDFYGYDKLYYEILDSLVGPGRIIVSAAGNRGYQKDWFCKERGTRSKGLFLYSATKDMISTAKSADKDFSIRIVAYGNTNDTLMVHASEVLKMKDSLYTDTIIFANMPLSLTVEAYQSCYDATETCYDIITSIDRPHLGGLFPVSLEIVGENGHVEVFHQTGYFTKNDINPLLCDGENTHNVLSPSSAPSVISVGATAYRTMVLNHKGEYFKFDDGHGGERAHMSSIGPTFDGRCKPDVMAPGINVISSYSSFYLDNHPEVANNSENVAFYEHDGRRYAWSPNSGTSGSSPAVAGVIALWLEACPTLTPEQVMDVIANTSRHPDTSLSYPNNQYGYGEIDAYRGLLYILGADKIKGVSANQTHAAISLNGNGELIIKFTESTKSPLTVTVYSLSGKCLIKEVLPEGQSHYQLPAHILLGGDVFVVQIDSDKWHTGSKLIRTTK